MQQLQYGARNLRLKRHNQSYAEYLASDKWKTIREKLRALPDFKNCFCCGATHRLEMHHTSYRKIYSPKFHHHRQAIIPLCGSCHERTHQLTREHNWGLRQAAKKLKSLFN